MMVSPLFRLNDGSPTQNQDPCTIAISNLDICERVTITYTITNTIYIIENDRILLIFNNDQHHKEHHRDDIDYDDHDDLWHHFGL